MAIEWNFEQKRYEAILEDGSLLVVSADEFSDALAEDFLRHPQSEDYQNSRYPRVADVEQWRRSA